MYKVVILMLLKLRKTVTILRQPFMYRREYESFVRSCGIAYNGLMTIFMS